MKLEYYIKEKKYHSLKTKKVETQYVAALKEKAMATTDELCKQIEVGSTLTRHEAGLALDEWSDYVLEALSFGRQVQIANLGVLHPRLESKALDNPKDVDLKAVTKIKCVFYPSRDLIRALHKNPLQKIKYVKKEVKLEKKKKSE